jgi:hypothetical protein
MVAQEPITIFAHILDPAGVARLLREQAATAKIDGPDDSWSNAVVTFDDGTSKRTLTFKHNPQYYGEPSWSQQKAGMRRYFSRFPDSPRKQQVMLLTSSFRFSIGSIFEPDYAPDGDERLGLLFKVAQLLDGVLFTPLSLRDANGRILFSLDGEEYEDPEAEWPRVRGEVSVSTPAGAVMHDISRPKPPNEARDDDPPTAERVARRALDDDFANAQDSQAKRSIRPQTDPTIQIMAAHHEAGHVVVAYWFGAILEIVEMGAHPHTRMQWPNGATVGPVVKGLLAGSLAGAKSLMLYRGPPRNPFLSVREHYEKYTLEALQIVRNGDYAPTDGMWDDRISIADILLQAMPMSDKEYLRIVRRYEDETQKLLDKPPVWRAVESVAQALLKSGRLNNDEAMAVIDKEFWESR